jgi:hypothetical protein
VSREHSSVADADSNDIERILPVYDWLPVYVLWGYNITLCQNCVYPSTLHLVGGGNRRGYNLGFSKTHQNKGIT